MAIGRRERVLITGGAGFIGSHLCERFLHDGYEVICLDNLSTGRLVNVEHLFGNDRFRFIKVDVTNYLHVPGPVDYVLHFASPASPLDYMQMPIQTLKVGSLGTHKVLGLCREKGARFLLASTSEVYGDPLVHPQPETYWGNVSPVGPRGVYDEAKRFAEAMTMAYHRFHGLETRIARIFNTYGPRMRIKDGRVVPAFLCQVILGEPLTVFGDGQQTRSFGYIDDLVEGLVRLLKSDHPDPVNLGNPEEWTVLDFAKLCQEMFQEVEIEHRELPEDDPKTRQPDISLARETLGWEPQVSLRDGILRTHAYFEEVLRDRELVTS
ncbi:MAG: UDP-glucuronic acid decarboxylase family protein [Pseudomonadota bacterium]